MNKTLLLLSTFALAIFSGCSTDLLDEMPNTNTSLDTSPLAEEVDMTLFLDANGEANLSTTYYDPSSSYYYNDPNCAVNVAKLIAVADVKYAESLNSVEITATQQKEIATYVQNNITKGKETEYDKMMAILKWVNTNVKYDWVDNSAYAVFKNKKAVCQGYANLMNVMLHTEGIKAVIANGFMANVGGHAWVYVYADEVWYVADPTNNGTTVWKMSDTSSYKGTLQPWTIDMPLYEDDNFVYDWRDKLFNIREVKSASPVVSIPYGAMGYKLTGFDPIKGINSNVRELYISHNIVSVGEYVDGLNKHGNNLTQIEIWNAQNHKLNSYDGCIYRISWSSTKGATFKELKYIPGAKKSITVAPMKTAGKNIICNNNSLEEIRFDESTMTYEAWCVENCPNVHTIYVPEGANVDEGAFQGCASDLEIVKFETEATGIQHVRM